MNDTGVGQTRTAVQKVAGMSPSQAVHSPGRNGAQLDFFHGITKRSSTNGTKLRLDLANYATPSSVTLDFGTKADSMMQPSPS
ncbi:hypothetical protein P3T76_000616 [Phytophthora citrophthora]|uniref:Uncharacterized protein n=1 Tax=Phytophthora citrophthora TaxID=4793 RepID=A0AAD9H176_9STRA|nr:hypothetical protein P3T76_000616 [Phytophthora citrophthora]